MAGAIQIMMGMLPSGGGSAPAWTPASLFESSEVGAWYDPSDLSTLWADDGTTPASVDGLVYRIDDKSGNGNHLRQATESKRPTLKQDAGGNYYLDFDGAGDSMSTASIDFTGTQFVTIVAGIYKDSNAATGVFIETGSSSSLGSFGVFAPQGAGNENTGYRFTTASHGTIMSTTHTLAAGSPYVFSAMSDTVAHVQQIRVNGEYSNKSIAKGWSQAGLNTPLYFGGRLGTSLYFNGRMYGAIVRGRSCDHVDLLLAESYMAEKSGASISSSIDYPIVMAGSFTRYNDPRALYVNGRTVIGGVTQTRDTIAKVDDPYVLGVEDVSDDHSNPSFLQRVQDNKVLAFYVGHNVNDYWLTVSDNANDATTWGTPTDISSQLTDLQVFSYANPVQLDGVTNDPIYLLFRADVAANNQWTTYFTTSEDGGSTWATPAKLINSDTRPYIKLCKTSSTRFDIAVSEGHPDEVIGCSIYHFYYENGWKKSDGTSMGDPPFDFVDMTLVYDGSTYEAWQWDIAMDSSNNPCIVFDVYVTPGTDHRYQFARWNGSAWNDYQICAAGAGNVGGATYHSGGVCMNPENPFEVVCSRESSGKWDLWRYTSSDSGETWSGSQLTSNAETHSITPTFILGKTTEPKIVYVRGNYVSYTDVAQVTIELTDSTP